MKPRFLALLVLLALVAPATSAASTRSSRTSLAPHVPVEREIDALARHSYALLGLDRVRGPEAAALLRCHGGELLSEELQLWRVPGRAAAGLASTLRRSGTLRLAEPDRKIAVAPTGHITAGDPLLAQQYWVPRVGADRVEPPGPGRPLTVIDSGVDPGHPEFAGRPDTTFLNAQTREPDSPEGEAHGTMVSSVAAAPANGVGVVGVYPRARLLEWDVGSLRSGVFLSRFLQGILAAADAGPGVINISLGTPYSRALEEAVLTAFGQGSVIVAAAGNEFQRGNPIVFPANLNHVLTVAATAPDDRPAFFSSASLGVDLAAPGVDIPVAVPTWDPSGPYSLADGTSFSAPIVAGAAAWVWTARGAIDNTQVFDLMRYSARDIGPSGFDEDTGFGLLDIPKALTTPAPPRDHEEPNEDVYLVKANGLFREPSRPLTAPGRGRASLRARLDKTEDPEDVYRAWIPAGRQLQVQLRSSRNVDVEIWGPQTRSVQAEGAERRRHLLASGHRTGSATENVSARNRTKRGYFVYVDVYLPRRGPLDAGYSLSLTTVKPTAARR